MRASVPLMLAWLAVLVSSVVNEIDCRPPVYWQITAVCASTPVNASSETAVTVVGDERANLAEPTGRDDLADGDDVGQEAGPHRLHQEGAARLCRGDELA